jgi:TetR/AcrR family transcriptional repressor of nem operon
MKVSREQVAENRQRILEVAGQLFRKKGFEAVGVAEIMKTAGLTHGGFYGYFASKDDLIVHALSHAIGTHKSVATDLGGFVEEYLSPRHRDDLGGGCPIAGLAADTLRQTREARAAVTDGVNMYITRVSQDLDGVDETSRRHQAIAIWAAMVGATILARAITTPTFSDEILKATQTWINAQLDRTAPTFPETA